MMIKFLIRSGSMVVVPMMMTACVFGENKQYFDNATAVASSAGSLPTTTDGSNPVATPAPTSAPVATPAPTAVPVSSATPAPTSAPVATPVPSVAPAPTTAPAPVATPAPTAAPTATPDCTAATTTKNLRIMFMVDNSGSTLTTDPNHNYRVKTVQQFLANYGSHSNLNYSFGYFNGSSAKEYYSSQTKFVTTPTSGFGGSNFLASALQVYENITPSSSTPYAAAFASLQALVKSDEAAGTKMDYVVVFMSDGQPTDISGSVTTGIKNMVNTLRTAVTANGSSLLTVSSVYFGPENDSTSIGNLKTMATQGAGQFVDTNLLTNSLEINDVITVPSCH